MTVETPLTIRFWTEEEFSRAQVQWDSLLRTSAADPLFMSWDWQWRWWAHHRRTLGAELCLVALYSDAQLVGLAPFYTHRAVVRRILHPVRMELIGTAWRDARAAFSDYLDIVAMQAFRCRVVTRLVEWLRECSWDELVLCCTRPDGVAAELAERHLSSIARVRRVDPLTGWCAQLPERFENYLARLSPEVRRRLFNQRRKLEEPTLKYAREREVKDYLALLWRYAERRWGKGGPSEAYVSFYQDIAGHLVRDGRLRLSRLDTQKGTLSVMFSVLAGNCVYYLQSGFDQVRSRGISPGYLHFGYAIEAACAERSHRFDFLGGSGRHRDYKRDLLTENIPLMTYHAVRSAWARGLYAAYGAWLWVKAFARFE